MVVLGIDPGSIKTGWAILSMQSKKIKVIASGVLKFNAKTEFLDRLLEVQTKAIELIADYDPDEIAFESLIYVKSPTALSKLAQTRGVILSAFLPSHHGKIYEYSPNLIKKSAVGHGHADKLSIQKVLMQSLGVKKFETHDESDAMAIALCHLLNKNNLGLKLPKRSRSGSLAKALAHKI